MTVRFRALWDGKVFIPEEPVDLPINVPLVLIITPIKSGPADEDSEEAQNNSDR
ncbi:MAG TPA: hypothetical protein VFI02_21555 [Armatimonadota bacterium]|nr:hypothetical protein [Armatimonadota bacterium]